MATNRARMNEALRTSASTAPVVDLLVADLSAAVPAAPDALDALLTTPDDGELTDAEKAKIVQLDRMKRAKAEHEASAKGLAGPISALEAELIELAAEKQLYDKRGRITLPDVEDGHGFELHPYDQQQVWPKYRIDPETDQPYKPEDVVEALRAAGLEHLIVEKTEQYAYPGYVRDQVKAWRQRAGQGGVRDEQGRHLDAHGNVLIGDEAADPTADILALPPKLRAVIEPSTVTSLRFSRREKASPAVAAVEVLENPGD